MTISNCKDTNFYSIFNAYCIKKYVFYAVQSIYCIKKAIFCIFFRESDRGGGKSAHSIVVNRIITWHSVFYLDYAILHNAKIHNRDFG